MSQIYKVLTSAGPIPPNIPTSFQAQNGGVNDGVATPALNIINFDVETSSANSSLGMISNASGNTVSYSLSNRITGSGTTVDGSTPVVLYSFPLGAVPGVYQFTTNVVGYDTTDSLGAGFTSYRTVRTTSAAGILIDAVIASEAEEGAMSGVSVVNGLSGNNLTLTVIGLSGKTIDWIALTTYVFVS